MAKIEGDQNIPAELLDQYRATLGEKLPNGACRKRYPYRIPRLQKNGYGISTAQKEQRNRWLAIIEKFKTLGAPGKARWFGSPPNLTAGLWYYDYFQMSGLLGVVEVNGMGAGVIKDIHHYAFTMAQAATPLYTLSVDTCDPEKSVPFFFGNGFLQVADQGFVNVMPYLKSLNSTQMIVGMSNQIDTDAVLSVSLIEYI
ncbi:MAG: hypothetical protein PHN44_06520 [Candidatus Marinimicrobia bacterium]|nr:hypothetical protein [Candidatus Neomarinimicrobiota bacterium]